MQEDFFFPYAKGIVRARHAVPYLFHRCRGGVCAAFFSQRKRRKEVLSQTPRVALFVA